MELKAKDGYGVRLLEGDRDQVRFEELVDRSFGLSGEQRFVNDFPIWADSTNPSVLKLGAFNGNELIGTLGVRVSKLKEYGSLKVGVVGAVCTEPSWRGKGVARTLIRLAEELARDKDVDALFLWSNQHAFYEKLGFGACGVQIQAPLASIVELFDEPSQCSIVEGFDYGVFELMKKRTLGLELKNSDFQWISTHLGTRWFRAEDAEGNVLGYVAFEKGIDLKKMIHDWYGPKEVLGALFRHIISVDPSAEILFGLSHFRDWGLSANAGLNPSHLCMAKVLNPERLFAALAPDSGAQAYQDVAGQWYFETENEKLGALQDSDLARLFFGPQQPWRFLGNRLPAELWFWGTDSA